MSDPIKVTVRLLDKDYHVACPPEEREDLLQSAAYLNGKMRELRDGVKAVGSDRIAVIAALNLANEVVKLKARAGRDESVGVRLKSLRDKVETALERGKQMEL
jgi:cell division protein ZapA